jgi:hypothetical protein
MTTKRKRSPSPFPLDDDDDLWKDQKPILGTTHMYPLTAELDERLDKRLANEKNYKVSYYKSPSRRASSPLESFHTYDANNVTKRQKTADGVVTFDGQNTTVNDGLLVTTKIVENRPYQRRYFVVKPTTKSNYLSRSDRRRESRRRRKEEKKAKKTNKGGSISRKTKKQRRRTNKTRKSKI